MPCIARIILPMPPLLNIFIIFCISSNCFRSLFTSWTCTPAPVANACGACARLDQIGILALAGVIELMIPRRATALSVTCGLPPAIYESWPGNLSSNTMPPIFFICWICDLEILEVEALAGLDLLHHL